MEQSGAKIEVPQQPRLYDFSDAKSEQKQQLSEKIIDLIAEADMTFDEAYELLEYINRSLLYKSRFVRL